MIDVIVSDNCPHCDKQIENINKSFFSDEFRVVKLGSTEFERLEEKEIVDGVPFVVVRDMLGAVKYAAKGVHEGTELRKIDRSEPVAPFNLRRQRELKLA